MMTMTDAQAAEAMRSHHAEMETSLRKRVATLDAFRNATDAIQALGLGSAILALFESHLAKENDVLIPALVADPNASLAALLDGMHELLGQQAIEA